MFVIIIAKFVKFILKLFGRGATTLPGRIANALKYDILTKLSANLHIICVTGTNGKTTTCAMIEHCLKANNVSCFINKSGANMLSGVTTSFIDNVNIFGKQKAKWAIIECDENSLPLIARYIDAEIVVVTNVFRDQLDRFGEVSHTLNKIKEGISYFDNAVLLLNADCPLTNSISKYFNNRAFTFGISHKSNQKINSDSPYCPICNSLLLYRSTAFGQLGDYYCKSCGYCRANPNLEATDVCDNSFFVDGKKICLSIGGIYNVYNFLASALVLKVLGLEYSSLTSFTGSFGRLEHFCFNGLNIELLLVKNPMGFSNCIEYIKSKDGKFNLIFSLNDNDADGKDVSWIWDVDFVGLRDKSYNSYTFGKRSFDMALRLKYDGFNVSAFDSENYQGLIDLVKTLNRDVIIFASYTSMMDMRHMLIKEFGGEEFWK